MQKQSGIYLIFNRISKRLYVGSSINVWRRFYEHLKQLRNGTHTNIYLLRAFRKYGEQAFKFSLLERVTDLSILLAREQYWMDKLKNKYNLLPKAGNRLGFQHSLSTKRKISARTKGKNMGIQNPMFHRSIYDAWVIKFGEVKAKQLLADYSHNMSQRVMGQRNGFYGRKHTPATLKLLSGRLTGRKMPASFLTKQRGNTRGAKTYSVMTPSGEMITVTNLKAFCQLHQLYPSNAYDAIKHQSPYKGFVFKKL